MKKRTIIFAIIALAVIGCGGGGKNDPCNCAPKAHLGIAENCDCGAQDCNCTLKVYGTIAGIPIYREKNVSDAQAITAEANIQTAYAEIKTTVPELVANITTDNVSALHITLDQTACLADTNGKYIIYLAHNLAAPIDHSGESIGDWLAAFNTDYLAPPEEPKNWEPTPVELSFGSVTMRGVGLTAAEWADAQTAIVTKFNAAYAANQYAKETYEDITDYGFKVIIEKNPEGYDICKAPGGLDFTLSVNVDKIGDLDAHDTMMKIGGGNPVIAKATPQYQPPKSPLRPLRLCAFA